MELRTIYFQRECIDSNQLRDWTWRVSSLLLKLLKRLKTRALFHYWKLWMSKTAAYLIGRSISQVTAAKNARQVASVNYPFLPTEKPTFLATIFKSLDNKRSVTKNLSLVELLLLPPVIVVLLLMLRYWGYFGGETNIYFWLLRSIHNKSCPEL